MAYIKLDDRFPDHPKVVAAGPEAAYLYVSGLCYCNRYLTDGFIPSEIIPRLTSFDEAKVQQLAKLLVDVCLWHVSSKPQAKGFDVHDYLDHQNSKETILNIREARKEAGRLGGLAKPKQSAKQNGSKTEAKVKHKEEEKKEEERSKEVPINRDARAKKKTGVTEAFVTRMIQEYAEVWSEKQVQEIISQALNHTAVKKALNVELYVQGWLRRDAEKERDNGSQPKNGGPRSIPQRKTDPKVYLHG